jgi:14-3-3 protein epsilon
MVEYMKQVVETDPDLNVDERNLLSVAYKNAVGTRRASVRVLASIQQKTEDGGKAGIVEVYKDKVEQELFDLCNGVIAVLDKHLIPHAANDESKIYFHKMKGDYFRFE